jgi:hypothetical protein
VDDVTDLSDVPRDREAEANAPQIGVELVEHLDCGHVDERAVLGVDHDRADTVLGRSLAHARPYAFGGGEEQARFDRSHRDAIGRNGVGITVDVAGAQRLGYEHRPDRQTREQVAAEPSTLIAVERPNNQLTDTAPYERTKPLGKREVMDDAGLEPATPALSRRTIGRTS